MRPPRLHPALLLAGWLTLAPGAGAAEPTPAVKVSGVDGEAEANVRAYLGLADESCATPAWLVRRRLERARTDAQKALRALGYYRPEVRMRMHEGAECWSAEVAIAPGPRTRVRSVNVDLRGEAREDPEFRALLGDLPLEPGEPLRHDRYEAVKGGLGNLAAERGYLDARVGEATLKVDPEASVADVYVRFDSGARYRIGAVTIEQDFLAEDYVRRFLPFDSGDPYSASRMAALHRGLADSGYFERVDVRPQLDQARDGAVPVQVTLTARKRRSYGAGVGLSTDTGPRIRLDYEDRRFSPDGERVTARAAGSFVDAEIGAAYRIPLDDPRTEWLSFEGGFRREDTDTAKSDTMSVGVRRTQERRGGWLETQSFDVLRERFTVAGEERTSNLLVPGIGWTRTRSDDPLYPTRGHRLSLDLRGSPGLVISDAAFAQLHLSAKWIHGVPVVGGRLIARGELGITEVDDFRSLPASLRFFAGGDQSVRGYEFESLGPTDDAGEVIGGPHLLVGSLEYDHPVAQKWGVAAFVDAGNALSDLDYDLKVGVGAGVRWRSPIGPVRLDVAIPLDDEAGSFRIHVSLGPDL